jgi:hypothetical protein
MTTPKRPAMYADVLAAPVHHLAELVAGELRLQSSPGMAHVAAASALLAELGLPFRRGKGGPGGWIASFFAAVLERTLELIRIRTAVQSTRSIRCRR